MVPSIERSLDTVNNLLPKEVKDMREWQYLTDILSRIEFVQTVLTCEKWVTFYNMDDGITAVAKSRLTNQIIDYLMEHELVRFTEEEDIDRDYMVYRMALPIVKPKGSI